MNTRIKRLRKTLDLTQQAFAERIGMKQNSIALIESGKRNISNQAILAICREFNVREEWLRNGEGEMFQPAPRNSIEALAEEYHLSPFSRLVVEKLVQLSPAQWDVISDLVNQIAASLEMEQESPEVTRSKHDAQLLREEADAVERGQGKSSASPLQKDA